MVTSIFTSKFKVMAFTVFGLSIILSLTLLLFTSPNVMDPKFWNESQAILILLIAIVMIALGSLPLLSMKTIHVEAQRIVFQNYIFGSIIKEVNLKVYDYYSIIHEETENGIFESVWLIKDEKLADSFSTFQYINFNELEKALNLEKKSQLSISPIKQVLCKLGAKI